jgi:hypothetical protein
MNTPSKSAQSEQNQTTPLTIDFSHRLSTSSGVNYCTLSDTVDMMAYRATAILNILSDQFVLDDESDIVRASDEIIYWAIQAAINEVEDIKQVVRAYHQANMGGSL